MAEAFGSIMFDYKGSTQPECYNDDDQEWTDPHRPQAITSDEFKEHYLETFIDLLNDSDNFVALKTIEAAAKLIDKQ